MANIQTLGYDTFVLERCPVLLSTTEDEWAECGTRLTVIMSAEVRGDDYGSWTNYDVYFACGHTLQEMKTSFRHRDEI